MGCWCCCWCCCCCCLSGRCCACSRRGSGGSSLCGMLAEEKSCRPKDVLLPLEVTRAIGGRVGGSEDEFDEDGRASGLLGPPSRGGRLSRGDCWSAMGDVGFDEFRRWKRRWDSMTVFHGGGAPEGEAGPQKKSSVDRFGRGRRRVSRADGRLSRAGFTVCEGAQWRAGHAVQSIGRVAKGDSVERGWDAKDASSCSRRSRHDGGSRGGRRVHRSAGIRGAEAASRRALPRIERDWRDKVGGGGGGRQECFENKGEGGLKTRQGCVRGCATGEFSLHRCRAPWKWMWMSHELAYSVWCLWWGHRVRAPRALVRFRASAGRRM